MRRHRITINLKPPADTYTDHEQERVIEFFDPVSQQGGLIQFCRSKDNALGVTVYRHDSRVFVGEGKRGTT